MNTLDILVIALLVIGAANGFRTGLVLELTGIIGLILAVTLALKWIDHSMDFIVSLYSGFGQLLPIIAFVCVFVIVLFIAGFAGRLVKKAISITPLSIIDSISGAVLGALKIALVISVFLWILAFLKIGLPDSWLEGSKLHSFLLPVAPAVGRVVASIFPDINQALQYVQEWIEFSRP
ncbi:MAG: CvpA family protein [Cyclobacteriaceae bacterium]